MTHRLALLALPVLALSAVPAQAASPFGADVALIIPGNWTQETVPRDDTVPFPVDASPVIRIGDGPLMQMGEGVEARLFHLPDGGVPVRVDVTLDVSTFPMPGGSVDWIRLVPDELLVDGDRYELRFEAPIEDGEEPDPNADERIGNQFMPVEFVAGPADARAPISPDIDVRVRDHGFQPATPFRNSSHQHSINIDVVVDDADFAPHDTWIFFEVEEDFDGDVADLNPTRWVAPSILTGDQVEVATWFYNAPDDDGRRCVVGATEDAYGALAASDVVCADPVNAACDGCSSAGPSKGGALAILGMLFAVGSRRRRFTTHFA